MNLWIWLLLACALAYAWKLVGYFVPARFLKDPRMSRVAGTMTIGHRSILYVYVEPMLCHSPGDSCHV